MNRERDINKLLFLLASKVLRSAIMYIYIDMCVYRVGNSNMNANILNQDELLLRLNKRRLLLLL